MLWEQARRLAGRGHDVRVVSRADPDATAPVSIEREGVRIRQFIADRRSIARFIRSSVFEARRAVAAALSEEPADVLHVHQPLAGYGALASCAPALGSRASTASTRRRRSSIVRATG